jgi:hypothetical protein
MMSSRARWWVPAALCLSLAIAHTWPLATSPGRLSRNDNADAQLNAWTLAWVAHQLPRDPARLFQANIFHPARDTLAFSEPLIVPAVMGAPLSWTGASPVLVFNVLLIVGFALTAWSGYALVYAWTRDGTAALLAGSMFAFNSHMLTRLPHVQGVHAWGLPLALLAADRLVSSARWADALWLSVWMIAMAYTSGYLAILTIVMVVVVVAVRVPDWWPRARLFLSRGLAAAALTAAAVLPVYLPYRRLAAQEGMARGLDEVARFSLGLDTYFAAAGRVHYATWSERLFRDSTDWFFPGVVVLALAALAAWYALRTLAAPDDRMPLMRRRVLMLAAIAATGVVLSLGTATPIYGWLYAVFPPLRALRAAARFGNLFLLGAATLAGLGLACWKVRNRTPAAPVVAIALVAAANVESLRAPFQFTPFAGIPHIYSLLAEPSERVVLAEVPFYPAAAVFENAPYVLSSTAHWRPLLNGYSGYTPRSYVQFAERFRTFPDAAAVSAMREAGVTHVMVHGERLGDSAAAMFDAIAQSPSLERIADAQGLTLYRLR